MIAQGDGCAIINITSIEAENPAPYHSHYNASKGGLLMYTRASAGEDEADACLFLASFTARWITGASLSVDGSVMTHQIY